MAKRTIKYREMTEVDVPAVWEIERASFEFPWSLSDFDRFVVGRGRGGCVLDDAGRIMAYIVLSRDPSYMHVCNLAVAEDWRRNGFGRYMLGVVFQAAVDLGSYGLLAEVRESNLVAQQFLAACDFFAMGLVSSPYEETDEEMILFRRCVNPDKVPAGSLEAYGLIERRIP